MTNERRLIDADELLTDPYFQDETIPERLLFIEAVDNSPTVSAVEVVRCKDCFWNDRDGRCMNPKCGKSWYGCPVPDEHFCSYGEKRGVE